MTRRRMTFTAATPLLLGALALSACASPQPPSGQSDPNGSAAPVSTGTSPSSPSAPGGDAAGDGCWVHLYDSDDFKEDDDNFRLTEPGKYADLAHLPGANADWTDEADSIRVGPQATVTVWSETDFAGTAQTLEPGSEHPNLDEASSLEMTCTP